MRVRFDIKAAILQDPRFRTQRALAQRTSIPEIRLSNIIRGFAHPSSTERELISAALGTDFFAEEDVTGVGTEPRSARR